MRHGVVGHVGGRADMRMPGNACQDRLFQIGMQCHIDNEDRDHISLARVEAAFENLQFGDVMGCHAQGLGGQRTQGVYRLRQRKAVSVGFAGGVGSAPCGHGQRCEREFEFGQADHAGSCLSSKPR